jgi:hypothetical protein
MTVGLASTEHTTHDSGLGAVRRAGLTAVIVLGPLSITILRAILPYHTADDSATIAAKIAEHQTAQSAVLWLTLVAAVTLVPAVIAVGLLAVRHAPRLGTWGMALAVAGFSLLFGIATIDFTALAGAQSGAGRDATVQIMDELNTAPTLTVAVSVFVLGHIVGVILLGVALLRGRAIPAWAAWALIVSQPLHLVFAVIIPSNALDAVAWALTTVGFAAAAVTLRRGTPVQPVLAGRPG